MTPKEKAIEMHSKFLNCKDFSNSYFVIPIDEDATQCALIAVDEILNYDNQFIQTEEQFNYWKEVKQEIEDI
jgi:hypothetical protein